MLWDNNWIINNYKSFSSWSQMKDAYNAKFGTDYSRNQFKSHAHGMGLTLGDYGYGDKQDQFLKDYYPTTEGGELERLYNESFSPPKAYNALRQRALKLGLRKTDDYIRKRQVKAGQGRRTDIGSLNQNGDGYLRMKVSDGKWRSVGKIRYEEYHGVSLKRNECVIYLDGDNHNFDEDNLEVVTFSEMSLINNNLRIDRSCKQLTKTAVAWAKLYGSLKSKNQNLKQDLRKIEDLERGL